MRALGIILARAGSKGLPDKCMRLVLGRPMLEYTIDHARGARRLTAALLSTDSPAAAALAKRRRLFTVERPPELASDVAPVDAAARHALDIWERLHNVRVDAAVLLFGNIPVRAAGAIDAALTLLESSGADSVRSVAPVGKHHPDWTYRLDGDRMRQYRPNTIHRRQELEPLYGLDGAIFAVRREALLSASPDDPQSFLGRDRRALVQRAEDSVDVDEIADLYQAEAVLRAARPVAAESPFARRPFVIAEAGVNHDGCARDALALVDAAVEAGADAVKFQIFTADQLATRSAPPADYQRAARETAQHAMLSRLELDDESFRAIRARCEQRGITFLATPFSLLDVQRLRALRPVAVKLSSTDLDNTPLLRAAAQLDLPLIVSTGAATEDEIADAVREIEHLGARSRAVLLHCVSCYPTPLDSANLLAIPALRERFGLPVGFSDHTISVEVGAWAVAAGAVVLEKHLTLSRSRAGPDHACSLEPREFAKYVAVARAAASALGAGRLGMSPIESDVRSAARKSLVAATNLPAGHVLRPEDVAIKRPAGGLPPLEYDAVVGRTLRVPLAQDAPLSWSVLS